MKYEKSGHGFHIALVLEHGAVIRHCRMLAFKLVDQVFLLSSTRQVTQDRLSLVVNND